jgi:hypothetical protein
MEISWKKARLLLFARNDNSRDDAILLSLRGAVATWQSGFKKPMKSICSYLILDRHDLLMNSLERKAKFLAGKWEMVNS